MLLAKWDGNSRYTTYKNEGKKDGVKGVTVVDEEERMGCRQSIARSKGKHT
jgi:hypothetical protein